MGGLLVVTLMLLWVHSNHNHRQPEAAASLFVLDQDEELFAHQKSTCYPEGLHLAQADSVGDDHTLSFTLTVHLDYENCRHAVPTVFYWQHWWQPHHKVHGLTPVQFNYTSRHNASDVLPSPWIWHLPLSELKAGVQRYRYQVVVTGHDVTTNKALAISPVHSFFTPPRNHQPTSMALLGDLGQTSDSAITVAHIKASAAKSFSGNHPITQLLLAGDLSYADGDPHRWLSWFRLVESLTAGLALHVAPGNHEIEPEVSTNMPFVPYEHYFRVPNRVAEADVQPLIIPWSWDTHYNYGNAFYTYQHGLAQIVVLSSFSHTDVGSPQHTWLDDVLDRIDRTITPWLIVTFHAPWYTTFQGHNNETAALRSKAAMEDMLYAAGVNFIVSGHDHAYLRTHPLYHGKIVPDAPVYLIVGAGGNREHHAPGFVHPDAAEPWVATRDRSEYGYAHLFLANATHARIDWIGNGPTNTTNTSTTTTPLMTLHDSVWIINAHAVEEKLVSNDNIVAFG
jgi:hypothetical protein